MKRVRILSLGVLLATVVFAQIPLARMASAQATSTSPDTSLAPAQVIAAGRHAQGTVTGEIDGLVIDGDRLTIKMTLKSAQPGNTVNLLAYAGAAASQERIYLTAGDKKYMLVTDDQNKPLASETLAAAGSGEVVGLWYGVFPLPPAGQPIMLYLPDFEPIGPFTPPAR